MASIKHKFQSSLPDGPNPSLIKPSNWNDEHDITGLCPSVSTRTELKALNRDLGVAFLAEAGREGLFTWNTEDCSARVASDPYEGLYVAPASDPTGASGAWGRVFDGPLFIEWFGANTATSASTNAAAINAACSFGAEVTARTIGTFPVSGTLSVGSLSSLVGRQSGARPKLSFGSSSEPTDTNTRAAIVLAGLESSLIGWEVEVLGGDYRRTVSMGGYDEQICKGNKIVVGTEDISASASHFSIFCASDNPFYDCEISRNDISGTCNVPLDGVQAMNMRNGRIVANKVHDLSGTGATKFNWAIYGSKKCYGLKINDNVIENINCSGIHQSNLSDGTANDYGRVVRDNIIRNVLFTGISLESTNGASARGNTVIGADLPVHIGTSTSVDFSGGMIEIMNNPGSPISADRPLVSVGSCEDVKISGVTFGEANDGLYSIFSDSPRTIVCGCSFLQESPISAIRLSGVGSVAGNNSIELCDDSTAADRVLLAADDCAATGNVIGAQTGQRGIRASSDRCVISGNRLVGGTYNIWLDSSSTNCETSGNLTSDFGTGAVLNEGTGNIIHEQETLIPLQRSLTQLADKTNSINTISKVAGRCVYVTTNTTTYRARGSSATDPWDPLGGGSAVTPA